MNILIHLCGHWYDGDTLPFIVLLFAIGFGSGLYYSKRKSTDDYESTRLKKEIDLARHKLELKRLNEELGNKII